MVSPAASGLQREAEVASLRLYPDTPSGLRQRMPLNGSSADLPTGRLCVHGQKSRIAKLIAHKRKFDQAFCNAQPKSPKVTTPPHEQNTLSKQTPSDGFPVCHMITVSKTHVPGTISKNDFKHKANSYQRLPALYVKSVAPAEIPLNLSRRKRFSSPLSSTSSDRSSLLSQMCTQTKRCDDFGSTGSYHKRAYSPPYHTQHHRRQSSQQMNNDNLKAYRVERRKAKSRVAAQVRRNREGQSLMLLQNALPISNEALNRISAVTQDTTVSLLSVFKDEPDLKDLITSDLSGWMADSMLSEIPPNSPGTTNLEKSDIIRIAGHTLFLLNNVYHLLGVSQTPSLNLDSQSLYGLLIDPKDNRIVYVTPALAEAVGGSWASFIGAPLHHLIESNLSDNRPTTFVHNRISRRKNHFASQSVLNDSCDVHKRWTVFANPSTRAPEVTHFVRLLKCTTGSTSSPNTSHGPFNGCEERIPSVKTTASGGNHYSQQRKEWSRGHRKQYPTSDLPFQMGGADWSVESRRVTSDELIYYCWATAILEPPVAISVDSGINQLTEDTLAVPETDLVSDKRYLSEEESGSSISYCSSTTHHHQTPLKLYLLQPVDLSPTEVPIDSDPVQLGNFIPEPHVTSVDERLLVPVGSGRGRSGRRRGSKFQGKYISCHPVAESKMVTNADVVVEPTENPMPDMLDKLTWDADMSDILSLLSAKRLADQWFTCLDVTQLVVKSIRGSCQACLGLVNYGDKLLGRSFLGLLHPDDLDAVVSAFSETLLTGSPVWTPVYRIAELDAEQGCKRYRWVRSMVWVDRDGQNLHCWHQPAGCESSDRVRVVTMTEPRLLPTEVAKTCFRSSVDKDCKNCFTAATSDQIRKVQSNICAVEKTRFRPRQPIIFLSPELKFLHRTGQNRLTIVLKRNQTPFHIERPPDDSNQKDDTVFQVSSPIHGPVPKTKPNPAIYKSDLSNVVKKHIETAQWQPKLVRRMTAPTRHRLWVSAHHRMTNQTVHSSKLDQRGVFVPRCGDVPVSSKHCRMQQEWASYPGVYAFSSNQPPSLSTDEDQWSGSSTSNSSSLVDTPRVGNTTTVSSSPLEPRLTGLASMVDDLLGHKENRQNSSVHFATRQSCK